MGIKGKRFIDYLKSVDKNVVNRDDINANL